MQVNGSLVFSAFVQFVSVHNGFVKDRGGLTTAKETISALISCHMFRAVHTVLYEAYRVIISQGARMYQYRMHIVRIMETRRVIYPVLYKSAHIVTITLAGFIVFTAEPGSSLFSWHPALMAITFLFLTFEAVLVIDSDHSPLVGSPRSTQILFHQIINISSFACAMCGFIAIYYHKDLSGSDHFKTWHGTMGVITLVIQFLQIIGGMITKYRYPYVQKLLNLKLKGLDLKIFHSSFGLLLYAVVWLTIICAMFSAWFSEHVAGILWSICLLCAIFLAIVSMHQILLFFILFVQIRIVEMFINGFVAIMRKLFLKPKKAVYEKSK